MNIKRNALLALMGLVMAGAAVTGASADTTHPRRAQVNERLAHQNQRIHQERREGKLSAHEARRLHKADHRVRAQEQRFASRHGGHITRAEQGRLNREENHVGQHIPG